MEKAEGFSIEVTCDDCALLLAQVGPYADLDELVDDVRALMTRHERTAGHQKAVAAR